MQGKQLLHKFIKESCTDMHKKLKEALVSTCTALLKCKKLSISALGRAIESKTAPKHQIKRVDRLISNESLMNYKSEIYKNLITQIIPKNGYLPIIVDTCFLTSDSEFQVLRGSLALEGRSLTVYEIVYRQGELSVTMEVFLKKLKNILPSTAKVIMITDAGFHNRWFRLVKKQGWDFLGRVRQNKSFITSEGIKKYSNELHLTAKSLPQYDGEVKLCKTNQALCHLYTIKKKLKGRKKKNSKGTIAKRGYSKTQAKSQREPWVLASSLPIDQFNPQQVIALYGLRMQIEESFRDMKNFRYGLSFKQTLTRNIKRLNALMLISAIVTFIAYLLGKIAESKNWHLKYQSNTLKRRTLSLFYLGSLIADSKFQINISDIKEILKDTKNNYPHKLLSFNF